MARSRDRAQVCSWGRLCVPATEERSEYLEEVARGAVLTRGWGRAYGDAAFPPAGVTTIAGSLLSDRILAFDEDRGRLRAEAGLTLLEMNRLFLPRGWFTPVSPGTQQVTLGGMVAADVHGKNHHRAGSFGEHVQSLLLLTGDGRPVACGPEVEPDLFWATIGGMGLTGHILEVELDLERIPSPWLRVESRRCRDLAEVIDGLTEAGSTWPFTVAWIDCLATGRALGRGLLSCGRWAETDEAPSHQPRPLPAVVVPPIWPGGLLNRWTIGAFNRLYYWRHLRRCRTGLAAPGPFFYPLDVLLEWNRLYGSRGLIQYQCVIPREEGTEAVRRLLRRLQELRGRAYLAVLKDFGSEGRGLLSFPRPGLTLAIDLPRDRRAQAVVDGLNELVIELGGRIYLAKDALTRAEQFARMESRLGRFREVRRRWDPDGRLDSRLAQRLMVEGS